MNQHHPLDTLLSINHPRWTRYSAHFLADRERPRYPCFESTGVSPSSRSLRIGARLPVATALSLLFFSSWLPRDDYRHHSTDNVIHSAVNQPAERSREKSFSASKLFGYGLLVAWFVNFLLLDEVDGVVWLFDSRGWAGREKFAGIFDRGIWYGGIGWYSYVFYSN